MIKYFFSHSTANKEIVNKFIDALVLGKVIERDSVFCSSRTGDDIETGDKFVGTIGTSLQEAKEVFCFFSRNYLDSTFCMAELGACWILEKNVHPIIIPDIDFDETTPFCRDLQGIKINDESGLDKIVDTLGDQAKKSVAAWGERKKEFLKELHELLEKKVKPNKIEYAVYSGVVQQSKKQNEEIEKLKEELRNRKQYIEKLEKLKDKEEIEKIKEPTDFENKFEKLCKKIREDLQSLPEGVAWVCFKDNQGEEFTHKEAMYKNICLDDAIDNGYLRDSGDSFNLDTSAPEIEELEEDINELRRFIDSNEFLEIKEKIRKEYKLEPSLRNKKFWTECIKIRF